MLVTLCVCIIVYMFMYCDHIYFYMFGKEPFCSCGGILSQKKHENGKQKLHDSAKMGLKLYEF